jgi:hypothetical protein
MTNKPLAQALTMGIGDSVRQGDVLLVRRDRAPMRKTKVARERGGVVLAHGEVTGHMHQLRGPQVAMFRDDRGHGFVEIKGTPEALVHDEHTALLLPPGAFELGVQVEHEPAYIRIVAD